jgi:hypothetical protein
MVTLQHLVVTFKKYLNSETARSARLTAPPRQSLEAAAAAKGGRHLLRDPVHSAARAGKFTGLTVTTVPAHQQQEGSGLQTKAIIWRPNSPKPDIDIFPRFADVGALKDSDRV